jgi:hypothetical protein
MTWFKVDDSFHSHPKVLTSSLEALGLWVVAGTWSAHNLTDGFVSGQVLLRLHTDATSLAEELVTVGLWKRAKGGYQFHDWIEYQPTKEEVEAERRKWAEKKAKQRAAKSPGDTPGDSTEDSPGESQGSRSRSRGPKGPSTAQAPPTKGTLIADDFWMTEDMITWGKQKAPLVNGTRETEKFVNYWKSKTGKDATKKDWVRTWRNWMLNAQERAEQNAQRNGEDLTRHVEADDERCAKHPRQLAGYCQTCDSEARGAA